MRFAFNLPVKPFHINQAWGVFHEDPQNPGHSIYERFGFTLHNGTDVALGADKTIYASFEGDVIRVANQPKGGGIYVTILSSVPFDFDDGQSHFVMLDALHCEKVIVNLGDHVQLGQALAIADNTGFSTGPHTHFQLRRVGKAPIANDAIGSFHIGTESFTFSTVDTNGANNSFDPMPYATTTFAKDMNPANAPASAALIAFRDKLIRQLIARLEAMLPFAPK